MLRCTRYQEQDFTLFQGAGELYLQGWMEVLEAYAQDGPTSYELYDLRELANTLSDDDIRRLAKMSDLQKDLRPPGSKTAIVVSSSLQRWAARFYSILAEVAHVNWTTRSFATLEEAAAWLGIDLTEIDGI